MKINLKQTKLFSKILKKINNISPNENFSYKI